MRGVGRVGTQLASQRACVSPKDPLVANHPRPSRVVYALESGALESPTEPSP